MLYYNRPFPQQWTDNGNVLSNGKKAIAESVIGVRLQLPIDQYHKITAYRQVCLPDHHPHIRLAFSYRND